MRFTEYMKQLDPTINLFGNHLTAIIFFVGMIAFVTIGCLLYHKEEKDREKRKDNIFQMFFLNGLFAVGTSISLFFWLI